MRHEFKNTPYLHVIDKSKWQRNIKSSLNNWTDSQSCWFEFVVNEENFVQVHRKWNQMVKIKTNRFQSEQSQHDHRKHQFYSKIFYFIGFKNHVFFSNGNLFVTVFFCFRVLHAPKQRYYSLFTVVTGNYWIAFMTRFSTERKIKKIQRCDAVGQ